jgi:hypothetical protein
MKKFFITTTPCVSDWVDSLIRPSGLLLVVSPHLLAVQSFDFGFNVDWGNGLVTKTWM